MNTNVYVVEVKYVEVVPVACVTDYEKALEIAKQHLRGSSCDVHIRDWDRFDEGDASIDFQIEYYKNLDIKDLREVKKARIAQQK